MTTSSDLDWLFHYDFTWEGWEEERPPTPKELSEFMHSQVMLESVMKVLERDIGGPIEIEEHIDHYEVTTLGDPNRRYQPGLRSYSIKVNGEMIADEYEAGIILTGILTEGRVPEMYVEAYRANLGLRYVSHAAVRRDRYDFRPVFGTPSPDEPLSPPG